MLVALIIVSFLLALSTIANFILYNLYKEAQFRVALDLIGNALENLKK